MRSTNRSRAMIVSSSIILICLTVLVGMTVVLFTEQEVVGNHLRAGDLNITLERTKLTSTYLTNLGELDTIVNDEVKDFTRNVKDNVFDLNGAVIVPQSKYTAEMKITNGSERAPSDVDFAYWIEIVYNGESDVPLAEQINVTVNTEASKRLNEGLTVGSETDPIGVLAVGESAEFTVTIEFLDLDIAVNNEAQGNNVKFDLVVHAVQYTGLGAESE